MCAANSEDHENKTYTGTESEEFLWIFVQRQRKEKKYQKYKNQELWVEDNVITLILMEHGNSIQRGTNENSGVREDCE